MVFGTSLFWYVAFSVFGHFGNPTLHVWFIGSLNFIPTLLRRERHDPSS
jgi:hypothetical protein